MNKEVKIITIQELLDSKKRKEEELEYYKERLQFLQYRVSLLQGDIDITNKIITMIETESLIEIKKDE